ncbi:MAG: primosomal protein N' [Bacilli bacterium]
MLTITKENSSGDMKLLDVFIEYASLNLDRPFIYSYSKDKKIDKGYRVLLEFANRELVGYVTNVKEVNKTIEQVEEEMGFKINEIIDVIDTQPLLNEELLLLADNIKEYYLSSYISVLQTMLPTSLNIKKSSFRGPKISYDTFVKNNEKANIDIEQLTPKQKELYLLIKEEGEVNKREIKSVAVLSNLLKQDAVLLIKKEKRRLKFSSNQIDKIIELNEDQKNVINEFLTTDDETYLLQGVTGSGKTEVYLNICKEYLSKGKSVIVLVPEISLTPMMSSLFLHRFKDKVAILHSELTPAERYDEYRKIASGDISIVVGVRSAIFAPIKNLGLIIIDEEHVESYKQDNAPYYHAREVAIMRMKINKGKVLLASATPSLESRARAKNNVYHLLKLNKRVNEKSLPATQIVNMSNFNNIDKESSIFSIQLRKEIQNVLDRKEQAILLINRRGHSTSVTCRTCGHIFKCPNCHIPLTYHHSDNLLKCHHCDYMEKVSDTCPKCGGKYFLKSGFGTEKIEQEVNKLFPKARTLRLDSDSAKIRTKISKTIEDFRLKNADILIGTQMIAKGHDFQDVTLVGVVLADIGLSLPSFRSNERTFQLITQAVGRSGRNDKEGIAIIQTYSPTNQSIRLAASQNYDQFFVNELYNRKLQLYPPYRFLVSVNVSSKSEDLSIDCSYQIIDFLNQELKDSSIILGPICPYISYENGKYVRSILIKYVNQKLIHEKLKILINLFKSKSNVNLSINFDPYDF